MTMHAGKGSVICVHECYVCVHMCVSACVLHVYVHVFYVCGWVEDQDVLIDLIINYKAHHVA